MLLVSEKMIVRVGALRLVLVLAFLLGLAAGFPAEVSLGEMGMAGLLSGMTHKPACRRTIPGVAEPIAATRQLSSRLGREPGVKQ